jgi:predicted acylesterase/phospholipase RssA
MIKNIIFSGGAFKGWAYIGTLRALNEYIDFNQIENVAGTSIGSLFGFFYVLQIPWEKLLEKIMNISHMELLDVQIETIISKQCIIKGHKFKKYIQDLIKDYVDPEITFINFRKKSNIVFTATCLNINKGVVEYFNYENTPDVKIIDALIASCSVPLLFPIYQINNQYYCDGGLCNNFPTNLFDDLYSIGFDLFDENQLIGNQKVTLLDVLNCVINMANKNYKSDRMNCFNILDYTFDNQTYNLKQTKDDIFNIYMNGYANSKRVIFDNFIALKN